MDRGRAQLTEVVEGPSAPVPARIRGIDLARAIAIVGMFAVHIGPVRDPVGPAARLYALPHGRASLLFCLLAGVGVSLLAGSRSASRRQVVVTLLWRAVVLLPLGLWLQTLDHRVFVILQDYALLFLVGLVVLPLATRWLLPLAVAVGLAGSLGYLAGLVLAPEAFTRDEVAFGQPFGEVVHGLVLSGPYPLITWSAPFLVGVWVGRRDLRQRSTQVGMVTGGAALAVGSWAVARLLLQGTEPEGWARVVTDAPHSQMPLWLLGATGSALLVLGACLLLADLVPRLVQPGVAIGQLAFTVYVVHVLTLHGWRDALTAQTPGAAAWLVVATAAVAAVVATAWRAVWPRGPAEFVLHLPRAVAGRRARRSLPHGGPAR